LPKAVEADEEGLIVTNMSMIVLEYPETLEQQQLEDPALNLASFELLADYARKCGPYRLAEWAKSRGLSIFYVDNCWVRVILSGMELREFYGDVLDAQTLAKFGARIVDHSNYVIQAEEF
jgi:hypothetical protein